MAKSLDNNQKNISVTPQSLNQSINVWKRGFALICALLLLTLLALFRQVNQDQIVMVAEPSSKRCQPCPISDEKSAPQGNEQEDIASPVVVYEPDGLFNDDEREQIKTKIIEPFFDYENDKEIQYISMIVKKDPSAEYQYSFMAIGKNGGYQGSVIEYLDGQFSYWVPTCMVECDFSPAFTEKYPEIVKLANPQ